MIAPLVAALVTWLALHYLTGVFRIAMMTQLPVMSRPTFVMRGNLAWHAPLWAHLALRANRPLLFVKAAVAFLAAWKLWDWLL